MESGLPYQQLWEKGNYSSIRARGRRRYGCQAAKKLCGRRTIVPQHLRGRAPVRHYPRLLERLVCYEIGVFFLVFSHMSAMISPTVAPADPSYLDCQSFATYSPDVFRVSSRRSRMDRKSGFVPKSARPFLAKAR